MIAPFLRTELFDGFADDVGWQWMAITPAELETVRYIEYDYRDELSGGTRLAVDAASGSPEITLIEPAS